MPTVLLARHAQASFGAADYDVLSAVGIEQAAALAADLVRRGVRVDRVVSGSLARQRGTAEPIAAAAAVVATVDPRWNEYATDDILARHSDTPLRLEHRGVAAPIDARAEDGGVAAATDARPEDGGVAAPIDARSEDCGASRGGRAGAMTSREFQDVLEGALLAWIAAGGDGPAGETWPAFAARAEAGLEDVLRELRSGETALVCTSGGVLAALSVRLLELPAEALVAFNRVAVNTGVSRVIQGRGGTRLVSFNEHAHLEGKLVTYR